MTEQAQPPPPGGRPTPTAPPPPSAESGDDGECVAGIQALLEAVRHLGTALPDVAPDPLDVLWPDEGTSRRHLHEMQELPADEGLMPG